jgi:hypothetical protein
MKMKTKIAILKLQEWKFKTPDGKELEGFSAVYLGEDYKQYSTSIKDDILKLAQASILPAIFEAEVEAVQNWKDGKATLKFQIHNLKFLNSTKLF